MKVNDFVAKAKDIATNYKTLYVLGCIGSPLSSSNYARYTSNYAYNSRADRSYKIRQACNTNPRTYGFDCVCFIKAILWGWNGNPNSVYGGASYGSNGVPDISDLGMINVCKNVSTDFKKITAGEIVYMSGHVGIYIGNGEVAECTPAWKDGVQITKLTQRNWLKHGFLPYVDYGKTSTTSEPTTTKPTTKYETAPSSKFLGTKGYLQKGDKGKNVEKLCKFLYDMFPAYAKTLKRDKKNLLGNLYGDNCEAWVKEFQERTKAEAKKIYGISEKDYVDGKVGKVTLAMLKRYGFKE